MTSVLWLLLAAALFVTAALAFWLGRTAGAGAAEAARGADRLDAERRLGEGRTALAEFGERVQSAERARDAGTAELARLRSELGETRSRADKTAGEGASLLERVGWLDRQLAAERSRAAELQEKLGAAGMTLSRLETELKAERALGAERLETLRKAEDERRKLFTDARVDMANSFEKLAAGILEDKSKRFTDHNRVNLEQLLHPLREKLGEFQVKVEGLHQEGLVGRTELRTQIEALRGMNEKLSTDANNLVKALKGSSKQQGDWGEVLLIGMLEEAGLREGQQYRVQSSFATEDGRQARPDVILDLPGDKHLVIDSKVSLNSYTEYCACDDETSRAAFLERHTRSLRDHIDGLAGKEYQKLHQLRSLDFVVMFVPIEPAYLLALAYDGTLWQRAWKRNVLLVSPGTLFPVIRTIAHIWQQEKQTKNTETIARQAAGLYDKFVGFAESFEDVGRRIDGARTAYDKAFNQLAHGKGHVLGRISKLKTLGLQTTKTMPEMFQTDEAEEDRPGALPEQASEQKPEAV